MQPLLLHAQQNGARLNEPDHAQLFQQALNEAATERSRRYIAGVRAYQKHEVRRDVVAMPIIWREGSTVLRDYGGGGVPVLVIPSLINRFHILDLAADHSLLRFLAARGLRVLLVDWDAPSAAEQEFALADYVARLGRVLDFVEECSGLRHPHPNPPPEGEGILRRDDSCSSPLEGEVRRGVTQDRNIGVSSCHILGYCMGGLLALALAVLRPTQIRSLSLMATPWNFPATSPAIGEFRELAVKMEPYLQQWGALPVSFMEMLFAALQPTQAMQKFTRFAAMEQTSAEARRFVLTEDWLGDGVPLTAKVAQECLGEWYGQNVTGKMQWKVNNVLIDPRQVTTPAYVMVPGKDKIVTPESALPLARLIRNATLHEPMLGHIGLLASGKAPHLVWEPLARWLEQH